LGTFGLSKSLITIKGCAGRYGSVIVSRQYPTTLRPYKEIYEYCTKCGACIPRCPVGAITMEGKEHPPCHDMQTRVKKHFAPRYGCGKCQTAVPCEHSIPRSVK